jgi:predicted RNA-binding Zn-ribbon protein involved in translation (DUF1610 family)
MFSINKQSKQVAQTEDKELLQMSRYCPNCNADITSDETGQIKVNYCPDCGTELWQPIRCVWCNNPVDASTVYCTGCGMAIVRKERF